MKLQCIARQVIDIAANHSEIAYAKRDTKADGSVFASFHFIDWETLQHRPVSEGVFLQMKFGNLGACVADALGEPFSCRAAPLPDGGCAVLRTDSMLCLFRPDGSMGTQFFLGYRDGPAYDLVSDGNGGIWFTVPTRDAIALFSLHRREMELRVGGTGMFTRPMGISKTGNDLFVSCKGGVKTLLLPSYEPGMSIPVDEPFEKYVSVFQRRFLWMDDGLFTEKISG